MSKYLVLTTVFSIAHHLTEAPTPSLDYWHQAHRPHRPLHSRDAWHCRASRGSQSGWVRQTSQGTVVFAQRNSVDFFWVKGHRMFHLQLRKKWAETTLCLACHFLQITGCTSPGKTVSIVVRGSNKLVIEEAERSIHDALCVIRCLVKKRSVSYFWRVNFIVKKILNEPENIPLHAGSHGKVGLFKNTFRYSYRYDCPLTKALLHWRILQERNKQRNSI